MIYLFLRFIISNIYFCNLILFQLLKISPQELCCFQIEYRQIIINIKMISKRLLLLFSIIIFAVGIVEQCDPTTTCMYNSSCGYSKGYCICNVGYIGDCNIAATPLTTTPITAQLTSTQTTMFQITPDKLRNYIEFTFSICQSNPQLILTISLWGQVGTNTAYNSSNTLVTPNQITVGSGCSQIITQYFSFNRQPNGQQEMLILGITDNSAISTQITISVTQKIYHGLLVYQYFLIAFGIFVVITFVVGGIIFIYKRRANASTSMVTQDQPVPKYNDIQYFQNFMPIFKADQLENERSTCSICLLQIQVIEVVRKTPCLHVFHSNCIDSWCLKSLNCPVCRSDLSYNKLNEPRHLRLTQILKKPNDYQTKWEQDTEMAAVSNLNEPGGKYQIRQSML